MTTKAKFKKGRDFFITSKGHMFIKEGDWKVCSEGDFVRIRLKGVQMVGVDVNGFNNIHKAMSKFVAVTQSILDNPDMINEK